MYSTSYSYLGPVDVDAIEHINHLKVQEIKENIVNKMKKRFKIFMI